MTQWIRATAARSLRKALKGGSGGSDGPVRATSAARMGAGGALDHDRPVRRGLPGVALAEVALEAFKEISPAVGADDEYVAPVVLVPFAAEIAERAKRIQGTGDDRLRYSKNPRQTAHRMRAGS